jgi:hypothetical protein
MALGPGKYDDLCSYVRAQAGIADSGGVAVIVINGNRGSGFSVQGDLARTLAMADILEATVKHMRADMEPPDD